MGNNRVYLFDSRIDFQVSTWLPKLKWVRITFEPFWPTLFRASGFVSTSLILRASWSGEVEVARKPVSPSVMKSGIAPTHEANTGVPQAIASRITLGRPSFVDGTTSSFILFKYKGT